MSLKDAQYQQKPKQKIIVIFDRRTIIKAVEQPFLYGSLIILRSQEIIILFARKIISVPNMNKFILLCQICID